MKKIIIGLIILLSFQIAYPQYWTPVGGGTDESVRDIHADTIDNIVYVVGHFDYAGDSLVYQVGAWKNGAWNKVGNGTNDVAIGANPVLSILRYNNDVFIGGYQSTWPGPIKYLSKWDGVNWSACGSPNHGVVTLAEMNGELFCLGWFDTISNTHMNCIAKWNGSLWEPFGTPLFLYGQMVASGEYFNGEYYFGGNFSLSGGLKEIVRWNGTDWLPLENGLLGICDVWDIKAYHNYLFVGGSFKQTDGNIADYIVAWDGQHWFNPFPNIQYDFFVKDLDIIDDDLYIVGWHHVIGDTTIYSLARYDGINFCSLGGPNNFIAKIAGLNDTLYAATEYICDGDTNKWIASMPMNIPADTCIYIPMSNETLEKSSELVNFFPNPIVNYLTINFPDENTHANYSVYDVSGRLITTGLINQNNMQIDFTNYIPGFYLIEIIAGDKKVSKKLMKI